MSFNSSRIFRRWDFFAGMKPPNRKASVARPEALIAASIADGPGTGVTATPRSRALRTSRYPGSAIKGVPASETSAMFFSSQQIAYQLVGTRLLVMLVIAD